MQSVTSAKTRSGHILFLALQPSKVVILLTYRAQSSKQRLRSLSKTAAVHARRPITCIAPNAIRVAFQTAS